MLGAAWMGFGEAMEGQAMVPSLRDTVAPLTIPHVPPFISQIFPSRFHTIAISRMQSFLSPLPFLLVLCFLAFSGKQRGKKQKNNQQTQVVVSVTRMLLTITNNDHDGGDVEKGRAYSCGASSLEGMSPLGTGRGSPGGPLLRRIFLSGSATPEFRSAASETLAEEEGGNEEERVKTAAVGWGHTLLLTTTGQLYSHGVNLEGQLFRPRCAYDAVPGKVTLPYGLHGVSHVACGLDHSLAVCSMDNSLWVCGLNTHGQLGLGHTARSEMAKVPFSFSGKIIDVVAGWEHSFVRTDTGDIYAFGWNDSHRLGLGESGNRTEDAAVSVPEKVDLTEVEGNVVKIATGRAHSLLLTDRGTVYAWGLGKAGRLGTGELGVVSRPTEVWTLSHLIAVDIACGLDHSLVIAHDRDSS
eukprot:ANDGO_03116.mRNA.3 Ultraviolet-B receptor UVR8